MSNICINCDKWKNEQRAVLMKCDSVFDAALDMKKFEDACRETCPHIKVNKENS